MKYKLLIIIMFFIFTQDVSACSFIFEENHPKVEIRSIVIETSELDLYRTFKKEDYIKINERFGDPCGPHSTYIRKDFITIAVPIIILIVFFLLKGKKKHLGSKVQ